MYPNAACNLTQIVSEMTLSLMCLWLQVDRQSTRTWTDFPRRALNYYRQVQKQHVVLFTVFTVSAACTCYHVIFSAGVVRHSGSQYCCLPAQSVGSTYVTGCLNSIAVVVILACHDASQLRMCSLNPCVFFLQNEVYHFGAGGAGRCVPAAAAPRPLSGSYMPTAWHRLRHRPLWQHSRHEPVGLHDWHWLR